MTTADERNYVEQARREKKAQLEALGVRPFAYRFDRSHPAAGAVALYDDAMGENGPEVRVAGRVVAARSQGKTMFAHLEDHSGRIQIYFRQDALGDRYAAARLIDLDDFVGVTGHLFRTRTGEVTVRATAFEFLTKSLKPLPRGKTQVTETGDTVTYGGVADPEFRYRQRYADLAVHPDVRQVFVTRAEAIKYIRRFLDDRGYLEVETPILQPLYGGASARPFMTHHNALDMQLFLRIAPELYLKKLVVGGMEKVFEVNRNFRNEGISTRHNPEFTMLEFYEAYRDYHYLMDLTEELVREVALKVRGTTAIEYQGTPIDLGKPFDRLTMAQAIHRYHPQYPLAELAKPEYLKVALAPFDVEVFDTDGVGLLQLKLFEATTEDKLVQPTFIVAHPTDVSPLARANDANPAVTDRFELFITGREMANGFSELNDPEDQAARFRAQVEAREAGDEEAMFYDADYLRAMEYGLPPTAGEGIGIDRLVMLLTDAPSIRDVILFPQLKPEA